MTRHIVPRARGGLMALGLLAGCVGLGLLAAQEPAAPGKKEKVPDAKVLARTLDLIREVFKDAYAKAEQTKERVTLVNLLLQQAKETNDDPAARFALLQEARDQATRAANPTLALQALALMGQGYEINVVPLKAKVLEQSAAAVKDKEGGAMVLEMTFGLITEALNQDDFDSAQKLVQLAEGAASKSQDQALQTQAKKRGEEVVQSRKEFDRVKKFADVLKTTPDDAEANLELGRYHGLTRGNWDRALGLLAKGKDEELKKLAQQDLAQPKAGKERAALGDAWWKLGDQEKDLAQVRLRQRAAFWYEQALAEVPALTRARLEKRIAMVPPPDRGIDVSAGPVPDFPGKVGAVAALQGHQSTVLAVAFSPDGTRVISGSDDNTGRVWDLKANQELMTLRGHQGMVWGVDWSPDGKKVLTTSWDDLAKLWDAKSGQELAKMQHPADINGCTFSKDGKFLATGCDDNAARIWDAATGRELRAFRGHTQFCYAVAFTPDGKKLLTGGLDNTMRLWDVATGKHIFAVGGFPGAVRSVAVSPDGKKCVAAGANEVRLHDLATGKLLRNYANHNGLVQAVAFSPDGRRILSGGGDGTVRLWETDSGRLLQTFQGHQGGVVSVAFSPGGGRAVSGGADRMVRVWGLPR